MYIRIYMYVCVIVVGAVGIDVVDICVVVDVSV